MPWTNVTYMEEINRFVILARSGRFTVTELCEPPDDNYTSRLTTITFP